MVEMNPNQFLDTTTNGRVGRPNAVGAALGVARKSWSRTLREVGRIHSSAETAALRQHWATSIPRNLTRGVLAALVYLCLASPAMANVAQVNNWALLSSTDPADNFNVNAGSITVGAGSERLVVVAAVLDAGNGTISNFNATLGTQGLTTLATSEALSGREMVKVWYLREALIPGGANSLSVSGSHTANVTGLHIYWAAFSGVDQTNPINSSNPNFSNSETVTFGAAINYLAGGFTFYATGNQGTPATQSVSVGGFTQRLATITSGQSSFIADTGVHASAGNYAAGTTITFAPAVNRSAVVVASLRPTTTTLGNGLAGTTGSVCPGAAAQKLDGFSLVNSTGSASVTALTVTTTNQAAIASMEIWNEAGSAQYFATVNNPASNTWNFSGGTPIPVSTTIANFKVLVTYQGQGTAPAGSTATTANVTSLTTVNATVGTDTADTTLTLDNAGPAGATWGAITPETGQITLNWTNPVDADFNSVVILRRAGSAVAPDRPTEGTTPAVNAIIGSSTVVYVGSGTSFVNTGLANGTSYYYSIFARDNCINYSAGAATGPHTLPPANLAVTKTATSPVYLGDTFTYTVNVTNNGPSGATNVSMTDTLPVDTEFVFVSSTQGTCTGPSPVTCNLGTLANAASAIVTISVKAKALGAISNTASASAAEFDPNLANNSSTVGTTILQIKTADVAITKTALPASVAVGANVTYTLTVTNNGPDTADAVTVTDPLPAGMTWVSTGTTLGSCSGTNVVSCSLGNMANGASATITIVATANAGGNKLNQAGIGFDTSTTYDPIPTNDSAAVTHMVTGGPPVLPLVCVPAPPLGPGGTLSGVINTYFPGTATVAAGATSITVGVARALPGNQTPIAIGDLLMVIQMQDATINSNNTIAYGGNNGTGAGALSVNAGAYEFVRATSAVPVGGGTLNLQGAGGGNGLINAYTNADASLTKGQSRFQVVRVPQYTTATLNGVTAAPWETITTAGPAGPVGLGTGGILAIDVQGVLTINAGVAASVDGIGFRGGAGRQLGGGAGANTDWRTLSTINANGSKGEGNAGTPAFVNTATGPAATNQPNDGYPNGSMARGAPGNAGGGSTDGNPAANDQNSGGGGGSNGGAGGTGGHSWNTNLDLGGVGAAVTPAITKLVLGGGGGAGTRNNSPGLPLAAGGAAGGGLMVIRAAQLSVAAGAILSADGASAYDGTENDGGGGGGAGGSVIVTVTTGTMSGLSVRARGGKGGNAWASEAPGGFPGARHGPGGGGGGGVVAYTSTAIPPTLNVSGGAFGITTTAADNFFAQAGGIGQTLFAAPGLIPGIGSASDCAVDPAITLTHSPATVGTGGTVTFVSTVTNVGPFNSTSGTVSVTITIDPGLAFSGLASGSGWSCAAPVGQSVTCTRSDALAAQTSFPSITFNATVIAAGPAALSGNSATVSNAGDINTANNTATDIVGVFAPTLARFRSFEAVRSGDAVYLSWQTSFESDNLGFRVYREVGGERTLLTHALIAGSALAVRGREMSSGRSYAWADRTPVAGNDVFYWLEDVGIDGTRRWTGPAIPHGGSNAAARFKSTFADSPTLDTIGRDPIRNNTRQLAASPAVDRRVSVLRPSGAVAEAVVAPWIAPSAQAAKFLVDEEGWYRVTKSEMIAAGFDPGLNPRKLQLFVDGQEQPMIVRAGPDGMFDPSDSIEFYGVGLDSPYDVGHIYWLYSKETGARIASSPSSSLPPAPLSFPFTLERRDRTVFFSALTNNGDEENFFGAVITTFPESLDLELQNFDAGTAGSSPLEIALQGATEGIVHVVEVAVNGQNVGSISFSGQQRSVTTISVPNNILHAGSNQVTLVATGGDEDVSVVDYLRLTYPHLYQLDAGALRMTAPAGTLVTIGGLADTSLRVLDVSDPSRPKEIGVTFGGQGNQQTASFGVTGSTPATFFAFTSARIASPSSIVSNIPSSLRATSQRADLLILTHASLKASVTPLADLRRSQGLVTVIADVTDVYDEFAFGHKNPYAIRDFLAHAATRWYTTPRFVLLVGDASFDPKQYLGLGDYDLLPTKLIPTTYLKTDSDDWFADFNSDGLTELYIGRLPARTPAEASSMVGKILARDAALAQNPTWASSALLVAGENDGFDFESGTTSLEALVAPGMSVQKLFEGSLGASTGGAIVSSFNAGQLLVNYAGHGSESVWSKNAVFDGSDATALTNGSKLPVVVAMTCLNGLFDDLYAESLAESLMKAPGGGAAAVWASSALTEPAPQMLMNEELFRLFFQGAPMTLGEAVNRAKAVVSDPDVRRSWILFGDPSMRLR